MRASPVQPPLFDGPAELGEHSEFLTQQLLTYLGNKRSLLNAIEEATRMVRSEIGGRKMSVFDGFSGSGVVSRMLKQYASRVTTCDIERYAEVVSRCYLANASDVPLDRLRSTIAEFNDLVDAETKPPSPGFIQRLYSPQDDASIQPGERVFYTADNGRRLDHYRQLIETADPDLRMLLLGPLLSAASVHANTGGVFKGFYKNKETGCGHFGGSGQDALLRIKGAIRLKEPVLSAHDCESVVMTGDINDKVRELDDVDLAYFDPPYNQHPYGSNYFMLNLLADYIEPTEISRVSGIPKDWNRSAYNVKKQSADRMRDLITATPAEFLLVSFSDDGFISPEEMRQMLETEGKLRELQIRYNAYRAARNLSGRDKHVIEHLYLVRRH